jgi:hypothetical protein
MNRETIFSILRVFLNIKYLNCTLYQYFDECADVPGASDLNILTTLNGKVRGQCLNVPVSNSKGSKISNKVFRWLSIPYAEPPVNLNRFKRPIPVSSWQNIINGTEWPNFCMQFGRKALPVSEDCLYLNVFVPYDTYLNRNLSLSSILVFIHGGSFTSGNDFKKFKMISCGC